MELIFAIFSDYKKIAEFDMKFKILLWDTFININFNAFLIISLLASICKITLGWYMYV